MTSHHVAFYDLRHADDTQPCRRQTTPALASAALDALLATVGLSIDGISVCSGSECQQCAAAVRARSAR